MISNQQLDETRLALIENWAPLPFYVWHREYWQRDSNDYYNGQHLCKDRQVIIVQFKSRTDFPLLDYAKVGYIPFMYLGVPIKLWK